jgi:hypothetical protein
METTKERRAGSGDVQAEADNSEEWVSVLKETKILRGYRAKG